MDKNGGKLGGVIPVQTKTQNRYMYLDILRGITLISMMLYHAMWDLVYIMKVNIGWFRSDVASVWQQSICWTFILLAGFCWSLGKKKWKRGSLVFAAGIVISLITCIFTPKQRIIFGVLTLLGTSMLLMIPLEKIIKKVPEKIGFPVTMFLFLLTLDINQGYLGFGAIHLYELPKSLYDCGYGMTFLGFLDRDFYSADYFPLFPWFFLFVAGYFLYRIAERKRVLFWEGFNRLKCRPLAWLGRHSLMIYMIHQPVIYLIVHILFYNFIS